MRTIHLNRKIYPSGTRTFGPANLNVNLYQMAIELERYGWIDNAGIVFRLWVDLSFDDGVTWSLKHIEFTAGGGEIIGSAAQISTFSREVYDLPEVGNPDRKWAATIIFYEAIDTEVTVELN